MSNNFAFAVTLPNARTVTVKATQDSNFLQILEDVCAKQGLDAHEWDLKHFSRVIDLGHSVRFAGVPNNATLELVASVKPRVESAINIVLQLESGRRLTHKFYSHETLWEVLEFWENAGEPVLSAVSGDNNTGKNAEPVCVYMRQDFVGKAALQATRLRSLGLYQGSAVIRLMLRTENQLRRQANVSAPRLSTATSHGEKTAKTSIAPNPTVNTNPKLTTNPQPTPKPKATVAPSPPPNKTNNSPHPPAVPPDPKTAEPESRRLSSKSKSKLLVKDKNKDKLGKANDSTKSNEPQESSQSQGRGTNVNRRINLHCQQGQLYILGEHDALLYHADDVSPPPPDSPPDEFYEVTIHDVKSIYRDLQTRRKELDDAPLQTREQKAIEQENARKNVTTTHPQTRVRIRLPDRFVLQGTFRANDSVQALYSFVRAYLENPKLNFYLFTTPPRHVLEPEKTLVEEGLVGLAVIYLSSSDKVPHNYQYLKKSLKLSDPDRVFRYYSPPLPPGPANTNKDNGTGSAGSSKGTARTPNNSIPKAQPRVAPTPEPQPGTSSDRKPKPVVNPRPNNPNQNPDAVPKWFKGTGRK